GPERLGRPVAHAVLRGELPAPAADQGAMGPARCVPACPVHPGGMSEIRRWRRKLPPPGNTHAGLAVIGSERSSEADRKRLAPRLVTCGRRWLFTPAKPVVSVAARSGSSPPWKTKSAVETYSPRCSRP